VSDVGGIILYCFRCLCGERLLGENFLSDSGFETLSCRVVLLGTVLMTSEHELNTINRNFTWSLSFGISNHRVGEYGTRGLVLLERVSDADKCTSVSQFLRRFGNNLPKGLQSVPQRIQERVMRTPVSFPVEVNEIGRVRMKEEYNPAIGQPFPSKEENNAGFRSHQASFPRAEVNEINRIRMEEEYKLAIAHPLAHLNDRENGVVVRSPQASFPSAEVNEIGRVWMEEEYNAAVGQPLVVEATL